MQRRFMLRVSSYFRWSVRYDKQKNTDKRFQYHNMCRYYGVKNVSVLHNFEIWPFKSHTNPAAAASNKLISYKYFAKSL